jgi:hypothetical protein
VRLLAIILSTDKRFDEKYMLGEASGEHRKFLAAYQDGILDEFHVYARCSVADNLYAVVTTKHELVVSVQFCSFGLFVIQSPLNEGTKVRRRFH